MLKAFDVRNSKGRRDKLEELTVFDIDPYLADSFIIGQSKALRRLNYKTQVLCYPENSHIRTRGVHTNEVIASAGTISEKLNLNTRLCIAIAGGHDLGHAPYGHMAEGLFTELGGKDFSHHIFSVVVAQEIEKQGQGLNLSYETLEGILMHTRKDGELFVNKDKLAEYSVVMFSDKFAYTFSDLNDAIRDKKLREDQVPDYAKELGKTQRERTSTCINALVKESLEKGKISFTEGKVPEMFNDLRIFMYREVYKKIDWSFHKLVLRKAYDYFRRVLEQKKWNVDPVIAVALLTDRDANRLAMEFLNNTSYPDPRKLENMGVFEILPYIKEKNIEYSNADLSWGNK
jgi:dGTPase